MSKNVDKVSKIEGNIYKITDNMPMSSEERTRLENLVDELAMLALTNNK